MELAIINQRQLRINELMTAFILSQDVKPSSKHQYEGSLRQYFAWIDQKQCDLSAITRTEILEYKQDLLNSGMSALTIGAYLCVVRKFYEWAEGMKEYPNVAKGIKSPKRKNAFRKQPLTTEQCRELLTYFRDKSLRDYAIINLILRTGLRTIEIVRANIEDIKFKGGQRVLMVQGKGWDDKDSFVCLTEACFKPVSDYLKTRGRTMPSEPLFAAESNNNMGKRLTTQSISYMAKRGPVLLVWMTGH